MYKLNYNVCIKALDDKKKQDEVQTGGFVANPPVFSSRENPKQTEADICLAQAIYATGIAPNVLENPHMKKALTMIALTGPNYVAPSRKQVCFTFDLLATLCAFFL